MRLNNIGNLGSFAGASVFIARDRFCFANTLARVSLGYSDEKLFSKNLKDLFYSDTVDFSKEYDRIRNFEIPYCQGVFKIKCKDGHELMICARLETVGGHPTDVLGTYFLAPELTGKLAELLSFFSSLYLMYLLNPAVMLFIDADTKKIHLSNYAAESFYGYDVQDLVGMDLSKIEMMLDNDDRRKS